MQRLYTNMCAMLIGGCLLSLLAACGTTPQAAPRSTPTSVLATTMPSQTSATVTPHDGLRKVDIGGYGLNITCSGRGSPTVVLDAMLGGTAGDWYAVQPEIAKITRVCAYSRAGVGGSDRGPNPRTSQQFARELDALLTNANETGPFVLVGHSVAGLHVRIYASQHPQNVAGVVLVDATPPDAKQRWLAALPDESPDEHVGIAYLRERFGEAPAQRVEQFDIDMSVQQVQDSGRLGDLPLIVIAHGENNPRSYPVQLGSPLRTFLHDNKDPFINFPTDLAAKLEDIWQELQREQTALSSNSTLIVAENVGHFIPEIQPQIVIDAVQQIVQITRERKAP